MAPTEREIDAEIERRVSQGWVQDKLWDLRLPVPDGEAVLSFPQSASIANKYKMVLKFTEWAEWLDRHEKNSYVWKPKYNAQNGILLGDFMRPLYRIPDGVNVHPLFAEPLRSNSGRIATDHRLTKELLDVLGSLQFEHFVYVVFLKMHELYRSLQILYASGYLVLEAPMHNMGYDALAPRNGGPHVPQPYTADEMASDLRMLNKKFFLEPEFLSYLDANTLPRKIDEFKMKVFLNKAVKYEWVQSYADMTWAVLNEFRICTSMTIYGEEELAKYVPRLYRLNKLTPVGLARKIWAQYSSLRNRDVALVQAALPPPLDPDDNKRNSLPPYNLIERPGTPRRVVSVPKNYKVEREDKAFPARLTLPPHHTKSYVRAGGDSPLEARPKVGITLPLPNDENTFTMKKEDLFARLPANVVPPRRKPEKSVGRMAKMVVGAKGKAKGALGKVKGKFNKDGHGAGSDGYHTCYANQSASYGAPSMSCGPPSTCFGGPPTSAGIQTARLASSGMIVTYESAPTGIYASSGQTTSYNSGQTTSYSSGQTASYDSGGPSTSYNSGEPSMSYNSGGPSARDISGGKVVRVDSGQSANYVQPSGSRGGQSARNGKQPASYGSEQTASRDSGPSSTYAYGNQYASNGYDNQPASANYGGPSARNTGPTESHSFGVPSATYRFGSPSAANGHYIASASNGYRYGNQPATYAYGNLTTAHGYGYHDNQPTTYRFGNPIAANGQNIAPVSNDYRYGIPSAADGYGNRSTTNAYVNPSAAHGYGYPFATNVYGNPSANNAHGNPSEANAFGNPSAANAFGNLSAVNAQGNQSAPNGYGIAPTRNGNGNHPANNGNGRPPASNAIGIPIPRNAAGPDNSSATLTRYGNHPESYGYRYGGSSTNYGFGFGYGSQVPNNDGGQTGSYYYGGQSATNGGNGGRFRGPYGYGY